MFAPTNDAFVKALGALGVTKAQLLANPDLGSILKFHVVSGKVMSTQLANGMEAATLEGSKLKFDLRDGVKARHLRLLRHGSGPTCAASQPHACAAGKWLQGHQG